MGGENEGILGAEEGHLNQALELRKQMERGEHSKRREHPDKDLETSRVGVYMEEVAAD